MYANAYAPGGHLKRGKMVMAHFNPHELNALDYIQGKRETCPKTGMRSYSHLEELLKNPHLLRNLIHGVESSIHEKRSRHARGGSLHDYHNPQLNHMANEGVHGDTELALIGPHTRHTLDRLVEMEGKTPLHHPSTGHPAYWGLDSILGGLKNMVGGAWNAGKAMLPSLLPAAGALAQQHLPALAERFGGETGRKLGELGGNFLNSASQKNATPEQIEQGQRYAQNASDFGRGAYNSYQKGGIQQLGRDVGGGALNYAGNQLGGKAGELMRQTGQGIQGGQGLGEIGRGLRDRAMEMAPSWGQMAQGLQNYGGQALQGWNNGQSLSDMARSVGGNALRDVGGYMGGNLGGRLGEYGAQQAPSQFGERPGLPSPDGRGEVLFPPRAPEGYGEYSQEPMYG